MSCLFSNKHPYNYKTFPLGSLISFSLSPTHALPSSQTLTLASQSSFLLTFTVPFLLRPPMATSCSPSPTFLSSSLTGLLPAHLHHPPSSSTLPILLPIHLHLPLSPPPSHGSFLLTFTVPLPPPPSLSSFLLTFTNLPLLSSALPYGSRLSIAPYLFKIAAREIGEREVGLRMRVYVEGGEGVLESAAREFVRAEEVIRVGAAKP